MSEKFVDETSECTADGKKWPRPTQILMEDGNNPWERSKQTMYNLWEEWEGMRQVVAQEELKQQAAET